MRDMSQTIRINSFRRLSVVLTYADVYSPDLTIISVSKCMTKHFYRSIKNVY